MDSFSDDGSGSTAVMNHDSRPRQQRRRNPRTAPMHTHPVIGPELAAEVRLHAANVEADAEKDGADPRVTAARVQKLRRWAAEIEAGLEEDGEF